MKGIKNVLAAAAAIAIGLQRRCATQVALQHAFSFRQPRKNRRVAPLFVHVVHSAVGEGHHRAIRDTHRQKYKYI